MKPRIPARIVILIALTLLLLPLVARAARFNMLTNRDGLSNSSVNCIYQDSTEFMWIGTWDGLNLYNGYRFSVFKFAPDDDNTISNNVIRGIVEQRRGVVWVSTDHGINRIETESGEIRRFYPGYEEHSPAAERVFSVAAVGGVVFCAATGWGIAYYDEALGRLTPVNVPFFNSSEIRSVYNGGDNRLLLFTVGGELVEVSFNAGGSGTIDIGERRVLFTVGTAGAVFDRGAEVFVVDSGGTVHRYDSRSGEVAPLHRLPRPNEAVQAIERYDGTRLIVALASSRVYLYDTVADEISWVDELSDVNILSLYCGTQGILWVGTDGRGVIQVYEDNTVFHKVPNGSMFDGRSAPVRAFLGDGLGNIYIGTKGNGIYMKGAGGAPDAVFDAARGLSNNMVYALAEGYNDDILIGHDGSGLDILSRATGRVTNLKPFVGKRFGSVYSIFRDRDGDCLWLGTNGYGLVYLQLEKQGGVYRIKRQEIYINDKADEGSLSNNTVFAIVPAGPGKLWVGTRGGGLNLFDTTTGSFSHFTASPGENSLSSNDILCLYMARDSTLWIGTSYGLNRMRCYAGGGYIFRRYVEADGLPNNTIHGILEDDSGYIWISTNRGISKLNPYDDTVISYYNNEELQDNEFSDGAYYRSPDGVMYFGGVDGFNYFDPDQSDVRTYSPRIVFNNFYIKQQPVSGFRRGGHIELAHDENFFSVNFSALEYIRNGNCEYAYILRGFNDEWVYNGTVNTAVFTNVPPGRYELLVRCTNGDKIWGSEVASLAIRIRSPWWNTVWAYLIYALLGGAILYMVWLIVSGRIEHKRQLLVESLSRKQQSDNYEAKLGFFTSIAHEFCTPLTLIYGSGEQLLSRYALAPEITRHVRIVKNNADRMQRLIGELLEFRKVDSGHYTPKYGLVDVPELVTTITDYFNDENGRNNIDLSVDLPAGDFTVVSDRAALEKIVYNLISNAYKYTPAGGRIGMELCREGSGTVFSITNTGKGIKPEDLRSVFNRFEILDNFERRANEGKVMRNGIGLALARSLARTMGGNITVDSIPGSYTTFTLELPDVGRENISAGDTVSHSESCLPVYTENEPPRRGGAGKADGPVVLVVDDEQQIRDLICEILADDYTILQAGDGLEAIEILKHERADLILSDISMPNLDGMELLKYIKDNELTRHIPVVFLTFKTDIEYEITGYELGSEAYIPKPFHPKHLRAVVRRILSSRSSLRDYYNSVLSTREVYEGSAIDADDKKFIVRLTGLIEDNISDEGLSLAFLCEKMFISRMQLHRKIKEITGMTPSEYIRSVKIDHAARLIKTTNLTVQEIMFMAGFNNKSYFYREFAKIYRMSPREMREKERS